MLEKNNKIWNESLWLETAQKDGLKDVREQSWQSFVKLGFPNSKDEFWKYTSTSAIANNKFHISAAVKIDAAVLAHLQKQLEPFKQSARLVFLNGWFLPQVSNWEVLSDKIDFSSVKELIAQRPEALPVDVSHTAAFDAMNSALFQDGVWMNVRPNTKSEAPLVIYFLQTTPVSEQAFQLRHWISLSENSDLKIFEWHDHLGVGGGFLNQQMAVTLAKSAQLEHVRLQQSGPQSWSRTNSVVNLGEKSRYRRWDVELGGGVARNEVLTDFSGGQSACELKGLALGNGSQHFDTQIVMNHSIPDTISDQFYRNVLAQKSRGVFGGRVKVGKGAQKTDAGQVHKTLLLSGDARADTKPQLEIDADDVKCSHGAAIGQLDEDSLFYLRSRGIGRANAEKILAAGFVEKVLDGIACESLRDFLLRQVKIKLTELFA